jgi:hypothetical protein
MPGKNHPIAYCPLNDVEAWDFPFFIKKGLGMESDQLLLEVHLWHLTSEDKEFTGQYLEIKGPDDLKKTGYTTDDRGVYIIREKEG